jgi:enoyl-[acyl-carrier protein] reductase II
MAGQSVGLVTREQPMEDILKELVDQAVAALAAREGPVSTMVKC